MDWWGSGRTSHGDSCCPRTIERSGGLASAAQGDSLGNKCKAIGPCRCKCRNSSHAEWLTCLTALACSQRRRVPADDCLPASPSILVHTACQSLGPNAEAGYAGGRFSPVFERVESSGSRARTPIQVSGINSRTLACWAGAVFADSADRPHQAPDFAGGHDFQLGRPLRHATTSAGRQVTASTNGVALRCRQRRGDFSQACCSGRSYGMATLMARRGAVRYPSPVTSRASCCPTALMWATGPPTKSEQNTLHLALVI